MLVSTRKPFPNDSVHISTDTRTLEPGDFFVPLLGENFDGHDHIDSAFTKGACGAFVAESKFKPAWEQHPNIITVENPVVAYLQVARLHRRRINPVVIALTGSSGKTTTKDMLFATFSPLVKTQCTQKNFNNEVGVAQTLLALEADTRLLIVEMGMRGLHQIDLLSIHAEPDIALITNIGPAHIGLLGSLENIVLAKLEISEGLKGDGYLVLNGDSPMLTEQSRSIWYGQTRQYQLADASDIQPTAEGGVQFTYKKHPVTLSLPGMHQVSNALGVIKVGELLDFTIEEMLPGLTQFKPIGGRWNKDALSGHTDAFLINDAYNANPDSFKASLEAFLSLPETHKRILILGGMKELGDFSDHYHQELGQWLGQQSGIDAVFTVGSEAEMMASALEKPDYFSHHAPNVEETIVALKNRYASFDGCALFLKGSRANGLEKIAEALNSVPSAH